jgi:cell division protein FtsQ
MQKEQESQLKKIKATLPKFVLQMLQGGLVGLLLVLVLIGSKTLFDPKRFPVLEVKIVGDLRFQDKDQIQTVLLTELSKGFYGLSVNRLKKNLLSLSWIEASEVKRLWPDAIQIDLIERKPVVIWNQTGLISTQGDLFVAKHSKEMASLESLPKLDGPEGRHSLVWQNYLVMEKVLEPMGLKISKLTLSPRGSWEINLENNLKIILGTREVLPRLRRFVRAYDKLISQRPNQIAYVDLRYTSGMAVGWGNNVSWLGRG